MHTIRKKNHKSGVDAINAAAVERIASTISSSMTNVGTDPVTLTPSKLSLSSSSFTINDDDSNENSLCRLELAESEVSENEQEQGGEKEDVTMVPCGICLDEFAPKSMHVLYNCKCSFCRAVSILLSCCIGQRHTDVQNVTIFFCTSTVFEQVLSIYDRQWSPPNLLSLLQMYAQQRDCLARNRIAHLGATSRQVSSASRQQSAQRLFESESIENSLPIL